MNIPDGLRYTKEHEWVLLGTGAKEATVGITQYAQEALGDVTFIELPNVGDTLTQSKTFGVVESVKAVSDLYAPVSGTVSKVNKAVLESPELVNEDPYGKAWMLTIDVSSLDEKTLMSADQYRTFLEEQH